MPSVVLPAGWSTTWMVDRAKGSCGMATTFTRSHTTGHFSCGVTWNPRCAITSHEAFAAVQGNIHAVCAIITPSTLQCVCCSTWHCVHMCQQQDGDQFELHGMESYLRSQQSLTHSRNWCCTFTPTHTLGVMLWHSGTVFFLHTLRIKKAFRRTFI
jgi:hypothetical protein